MWTLLETIHLWAVGLGDLADGVAGENRVSAWGQWELRRDGLSGDEKRCEWGRGVVNRAGDILGLSTQSLNVPEIPESGLDAVESAPPTPPPRHLPFSPQLPGLSTVAWISTWLPEPEDARRDRSPWNL